MAGSLSDPWVLAIDFGTTSSVVAARIGDRGREVVEINGDRRFPSTVLVSDSGELVVGRVADDMAAAAPERALRAPKTHLGEPHPVVIGGRSYEVTDLVAAILRRLTEAATTQIGSAPSEVRLSYPATWNGPRRQHLRDAATRAGINDPVLLPEPVAAAVTYAESMGTSPDATLAIYDLGGGTFDTAVLRGQGPRWFEVLGRPTGDGQLGGELFDELLLEEVSDRLDASTREQLQVQETPGWRQAAARLRSEVRRAKETLSEYPYAELVVATPTGFQPVRVTRDELETVLTPYLAETVDIVAQAVGDAGVSLDALDAICLSGGASRTPLVEKLLTQAFPGVHVDRRGDPKATIAIGAALATSRGSTLTGSGPRPSPTLTGTPVGPPAGVGVGAVPERKPPTVPAPAARQPQAPQPQGPPAPEPQGQPAVGWAARAPGQIPAATPGVAPPRFQTPPQPPPHFRTLPPAPPYPATGPQPPDNQPLDNQPLDNQPPGSPEAAPQPVGSPAPPPGQAGSPEPALAPQPATAGAVAPPGSRRPRWEVPAAIGVGLILIVGAVTGGLVAAGGSAQQRQGLSSTTVARSTTTAGHTSTTNPTTTPPTTEASPTTPRLVIASQHQLNDAVITPSDFGGAATLSPLGGEILCGNFPRPTMYEFVGYDVKSKGGDLGTIQSGAFGYPDVASAQTAMKAIPATVPSCFPDNASKPFTLSPATGGQDLCDQTYLGYADKIETAAGDFHDLFVGIVRCGATIDLFEWLVPAIAQYEDNAPAIPGPIEGILSSSATKLSLALHS